jgi:hypothetical protein
MSYLLSPHGKGLGQVDVVEQDEVLVEQTGPWACRIAKSCLTRATPMNSILPAALGQMISSRRTIAFDQRALRTWARINSSRVTSHRPVNRR